MMTPQQLKNSILQRAIEGKLVPCDLSKWKQVKLGDVVDILNGDRGKNYPSKGKLHLTGIPFVSAINLGDNTVVKDDKLLCVNEEQYNLLRAGKIVNGDTLLCIRGSLGKHGVFPFEKGAIASSLVILRIKEVVVLAQDFLSVYLDSAKFVDEIKKYDNGTAQPNLAAKNLEKFEFPLPPLADQKRIVAKLEELLPLVDEYAQAYEQLQALNAKFPGDLKKSLLQYAMEGKLVPCDLSKWKQVKLGDVGKWQSGKTPSRSHPEYYGGHIAWLKTGDLNDGYIENVSEYITDIAVKESGIKINEVGSVLIAMYGATIGKLGILKIESATNQACCACDVKQDIITAKYESSSECVGKNI